MVFLNNEEGMNREGHAEFKSEIWATEVSEVRRDTSETRISYQGSTRKREIEERTW